MLSDSRNAPALQPKLIKVGAVKRLHKKTGITVRLTYSERARLREAAARQTRETSRQVTPSELLREAGLARAAEILAPSSSAAA